MNVNIEERKHSYEVRVTYNIPGEISGYFYCHSLNATVYKNNLSITISSICELNSVGILALEELLINCKKLVANIHPIQIKEESNV